MSHCGDPHGGFVWLRCTPCGVDRVVAVSCKASAVCPRCGGRRMASLAAHLVERVLPRVRLRQWVLTLPQPLPRLLAWRPELLARVLAALSRTLQSDLQLRSGAADGQSGLVAFVQTCTSDLRLFVHVHALVPDGVFVATANGTQFVSAPPPTQVSLQATADALAGSVQRVCQRWRRGLDPEAAPVDAAQLNRLAQQVEPAVPKQTGGPCSASRPTYGCYRRPGLRPSSRSARRRGRTWRWAVSGLAVPGAA